MTLESFMQVVHIVYRNSMQVVHIIEICMIESIRIFNLYD